MNINRRRFLSRAAEAGGVVLLAGGLLTGRLVQRSYARNSLHREMVGASVPLLTQKAAKELETYSASAREEIRTYFHGLCLNVHGFVEEICSARFAESLGALEKEEDKHQLIDATFSQKVVTATEVLNRVAMIAKEVGMQLDRNWAGCCGKLAESWETSLSQRNSGMRDIDITALVDPLIRDSLVQARGAAYPVGQRPALSQTLGQIGESAILLLPVAAVEPRIAFPMFVLKALRHLWGWVVGQLSHRAAGYQTAISERLAVLGNRVGAECEQEMRTRIADLHHWQEQALSEATRRKTNELIPLVF